MAQEAGVDQVIRFEHVTKRFPGATRPAVDDLTLDVPAGGLVVLLGPSGCGKTTALKLVNRLYEYDSGRVYVEGREVRSVRPTELRRRIGYVIQSVGLFPHMTVGANIATVPELLGWGRARINRRVDELLELVGLPPDEYRSRYPAQLSGGQQQMVGLARALAADPSIMLMDEPFAALDSITRRRLQDELLGIQSRVRKTILFVTHDVEEAIRLADRVAVMREGRVVQYDTPFNILSSPADEFVADLVGAHDVLRRLSLIPAGAVADPIPHATTDVPHTTLPAGASLRDALGLLVSSGADYVALLDEGGKVCGRVGLQTIRRAAHVPPEPSTRTGGMVGGRHEPDGAVEGDGRA